MSAVNIGYIPSRSPEQGQDPDLSVPPRRRRRPALSCEQCRKRKIKCDRKFPVCDRCAQSGQAHACAYSDDVYSRVEKNGPCRGDKQSHDSAHSNRSSSQRRRSGTHPVHKPRQGLIDPATTQSHVQAVSAAENSLLERQPHASAAVAGGISTQATRQSIRNERFPSHTSGSMYLKGRDSQTRFFGQTNPMNMYSQFEELRAYIQEVKSENPAINKLRGDFDALKRNWKGKGVIEGCSLDGLLPPRQEVDELVAVYLDCFERTHRILHVPSFRREYARYWGSPQTAARGFVAQLLAMMASGLVLYNSSTTEVLGERLAIRETALEWVEAAESFLQRHTKRPDLRVFQIYCLSTVARRVNGLSANQAWIATSNLVKLAMSAGYHREPNSNAKVSPFHIEMRRRIWATIVELDLQASVDRGMPPSVREGDFNTIAPLNISDYAIDEPHSDLPTAEPSEVFTDSAFQAVLSKSLLLRLRICAWANSTNIELNYEDALNMDEELLRCLNSIPMWSLSVADGAGNQQMSLVQVAVGLTLRQYLIMLHTPFASLAQQMPKYVHSRRVRFEAAMTILCQFQDIMERRANNLTPCLMLNYAFQAALVLCHELYLNDAGYGSSLILRAVPNFSESLISLAETTLSALETHVYMLGKKMPEFYLLTMVVSLVKTRLWPASAEASRSKAAEEILRIGYRLHTWKMKAESERSLRQDINEDFGVLMEDIEADIFGFWNMGGLFSF
ncbi:hypothetical protein SI65_09665 [Aspergillus cristatus]|uniref:Zn(2)-C6 fungal-type domain-containing protein n=1 Tax=Aspergillus cristatus TaxID=573508 RepID=A0A1E3B1U0_ASPCR|nr:hypothetical protein SI65_09665 [Aspergillus cristatus]